MPCWLLRVCYLWRMHGRLPTGDTKRAKQLGRLTEGQAYHGRITAGQTGDEHCAQALDGVAPALSTGSPLAQ